MRYYAVHGTIKLPPHSLHGHSFFAKKKKSLTSTEIKEHFYGLQSSNVNLFSEFQDAKIYATYQTKDVIDSSINDDLKRLHYATTPVYIVDVPDELNLKAGLKIKGQNVGNENNFLYKLARWQGVNLGLGGIMSYDFPEVQSSYCDRRHLTLVGVHLLHDYFKPHSYIDLTQEYRDPLKSSCCVM